MTDGSETPLRSILLCFRGDSYTLILTKSSPLLKSAVQGHILAECPHGATKVLTIKALYWHIGQLYHGRRASGVGIAL